MKIVNLRPSAVSKKRPKHHNRYAKIRSTKQEIMALLEVVRLFEPLSTHGRKRVLDALGIFVATADSAYKPL